MMKFDRARVESSGLEQRVHLANCGPDIRQIALYRLVACAMRADSSDDHRIGNFFRA